MSSSRVQLEERLSEEGVSPEPPARQPALRSALVLALLCEVLVIFWIVASEVPGKVFISSWSIVMPGIFLLALLALVRRWFPRFTNSHAMLLVYTCLSATACLVGYGALQLMFPAVSWMRYYSTYPSWSRIMALLPDWVAPTDRDVLRGLFYGNSVPDLRVWLPTMLAWGGMSFVFAAVMIALALLMSRSWIREEKLTFPIVMLPLEMCQPRTPLWRSGLFWFGFAVPAVLESLLALNFYFPSVPAIQLKHVDFTTFLFPDRPWSAGAPWLIGFTPFVIGFAFLAPADISFSVFLFGIGDRLALVLAAYLGWDLPSAGSYARRMPYLAQQNVGAFMAFGGLVLWRWLRRYRQRAHERWETGALAVAVTGGVLLAVFFHLLGLAWRTDNPHVCYCAQQSKGRVGGSVGVRVVRWSTRQHGLSAGQRQFLATEYRRAGGFAVVCGRPALSTHAFPLRSLQDGRQRRMEPQANRMGSGARHSAGHCGRQCDHPVLVIRAGLVYRKGVLRHYRQLHRLVAPCGRLVPQSNAGRHGGFTMGGHWCAGRGCAGMASPAVPVVPSASGGIRAGAYGDRAFFLVALRDSVGAEGAGAALWRNEAIPASVTAGVRGYRGGYSHSNVVVGDGGYPERARLPVRELSGRIQEIGTPTPIKFSTTRCGGSR